MKSKIKSIDKNEKRMEIVFEKDDQIIKLIENSFKKSKPDFRLEEYTEKIGNRKLEKIWEQPCRGKDFRFVLLIKKDFVRLIIKDNPEFSQKFLDNLKENTEFVNYIDRKDGKDK